MYTEITAGFQWVVFLVLICWVAEEHSQEHSSVDQRSPLLSVENRNRRFPF